jgi:glutathionylspermidine synthase
MKTRAWPLEPEEVRALLRALQFHWRKWDVFHRGDVSVLPETLVLTRAEDALLREAAARVWKGLRALEDAACRDPDLLEQVAIPEPLHRAMQAQKGHHPRVCRCDFHPTMEGGWMISEFNEDVPSGFAEATGIPTLLMEAVGPLWADVAPAGDLRGALLRALARYPTVGLVHATAYSEDLQHVTLLGDWLREAGHRVVLGSPANLSLDADGKPCLLGEAVDAIYRYFPGEWIGELPNTEVWTEAAAFLPMMNPLSALVAQSKRIYALPHEGCLALPDDARPWWDAHMPVSRFVESVGSDRLRAERERWVLKGAFGRMGNTVRMGSLFGDTAWTSQVEAALRIPNLVAAQERFATRPLWTRLGLSYPTVGVYLVDGVFAGYFSRVDRGPLIHYDSYHVTTLVELS